MKSSILYIEDNEQNYYLVNFILSAKGFSMIWAKDGQEGIDCAQRMKADMVLLDIQLPGMDGYTVAKELRQNKDYAATPIIALTSYAMTGDREKAFAAGCSGYIEKPINPATFASQIEAFMESAE